MTGITARANIQRSAWRRSSPTVALSRPQQVMSRLSWSAEPGVSVRQWTAGVQILSLAMSKDERARLGLETGEAVVFYAFAQVSSGAIHTRTLCRVSLWMTT